mgnify:CR=1 FL=1
MLVHMVIVYMETCIALNEIKRMNNLQFESVNGLMK